MSPEFDASDAEAPLSQMDAFLLASEVLLISSISELVVEVTGPDFEFSVSRWHDSSGEFFLVECPDEDVIPDFIDALNGSIMDVGRFRVPVDSPIPPDYGG